MSLKKFEGSWNHYVLYNSHLSKINKQEAENDRVPDPD